jgi:hypothetical protein
MACFGALDHGVNRAVDLCLLPASVPSNQFLEALDFWRKIWLQRHKSLKRLNNSLNVQLGFVVLA